MARVLIIDDDAELRTSIEEVLRVAGHDVIGAGDGVQGVALYRERRPDLVITDIFMPEQDGLGVILELANEGGVKVIAMSGGGQRREYSVLADARQFGALRLLQKPFGRDELLATVNGVLSK
jgi:DNA-binding response OmpR family regulator